MDVETNINTNVSKIVSINITDNSTYNYRIGLGTVKDKKSFVYTFVPTKINPIVLFNNVQLDNSGLCMYASANPLKDSPLYKDSNIVIDKKNNVTHRLTIEYIYNNPVELYPDDPNRDPNNNGYTPTPSNYPTGLPNTTPSGIIIEPLPNKPIEPTETIINADVGNLYTVYECSIEQIQAVANKLWSQEYLTDILQVNTNPIENILSLKLTCLGLQADSVEEIVVGNVGMGVSAGVIRQNYHAVIGSYTFKGKYNSFLDCTPFTSYQIYLPFVGYVELNSNDVLNEPITINLYVDALTLMSKYQIVRNSDNLIVGEWEFYVAMDIPISASNMLESKIQKVGGIAESVLSIPELDFSGIASGLVSAMTTQAHTTTSGTPSANTSLLTSRTCYIKVQRPMWQDIYKFNHTKGRVCNNTYQLALLTGFTKCSEDIDLSSIPCTEEELMEIKSILTSGFYI